MSLSEPLGFHFHTQHAPSHTPFSFSSTRRPGGAGWHFRTLSHARLTLSFSRSVHGARATATGPARARGCARTHPAPRKPRRIILISSRSRSPFSPPLSTGRKAHALGAEAQTRRAGGRTHKKVLRERGGLLSLKRAHRHSNAPADRDPHLSSPLSQAEKTEGSVSSLFVSLSCLFFFKPASWRTPASPASSCPPRPRPPPSPRTPGGRSCRRGP